MQKVHPRVQNDEGFSTLQKSVKHLLNTLDSPAQGIVFSSHWNRCSITKPIRKMKRNTADAIMDTQHYSQRRMYAIYKSMPWVEMWKEAMAPKRMGFLYVKMSPLTLQTYFYTWDRKWISDSKHPEIISMITLWNKNLNWIIRFVALFYFFFWNRVSLCSFDCPRNHYVN